MSSHPQMGPFKDGSRLGNSLERDTRSAVKLKIKREKVLEIGIQLLDYL
jgi:hypothetical protein